MFMALKAPSHEIKIKHSAIPSTHSSLGLVAFITIVNAKVAVGHHGSPVLLKPKKKVTQNKEIQGGSCEMSVDFCAKAAV